MGHPSCWICWLHIQYHSKGNHTILVLLLLHMQQATFSLTNWSITTTYFCVQKIILLLSEHRLHFPERFGSYELVEWKIEPQKDRYVCSSLSVLALFLAVILGYLPSSGLLPNCDALFCFHILFFRHVVGHGGSNILWPWLLELLLPWSLVY